MSTTTDPKQEQRIPVLAEPIAMDPVAQGIFNDVMAELQNAEEAGGPEDEQYLRLMESVAAECMRRHAVFKEQMRIVLPLGWDPAWGEAPPCAKTMGCLCAGHARGAAASEPCNPIEDPPPRPKSGAAPLVDMTRDPDKVAFAKLLRVFWDDEVSPGIAELVAATGMDPMEISRAIDLAKRIAEDVSTAPRTEPTIKCPKCGQDHPDELSIMETYTAYHRIESIESVVPGVCKLCLRSAFVVGSEAFDDGEGDYMVAFDDGEGDYMVHCNTCAHVGKPVTFGLPDPSEWEWV